VKQISIAGFGGQGILFAGKFLAYMGMAQGQEVSWLPTYGPETRGGTSNCGVIVSDEPIGSPVVLSPDILICMNLPSLDKYESTLAANGALFVDSSLAERKAAVNADAAVFYVPATRLAFEHEIDGLANMIMIGKVLRECRLFGWEAAEAAMRKTISERKKDMLERNLKAVKIGMAFE
jgi:2-oxoglutarate ferredoxin oxidoreductase subunit gamma